MGSSARAVRESAGLKSTWASSEWDARLCEARMAENKTKPTNVSVSSFIGELAEQARRDDAKTLVALMREATGEKPKMWGPSS